MSSLLNLKKGVADSSDVVNVFEVASANGARMLQRKAQKEGLP